MKKILSDIMLGKSNKFNGLIALMIVCSIVLGCQCNKILDAAKKGSEGDDPPVAKKNDGQNPNTNPFGKNTANETTDQTDDDSDEAPTYTKADASKKQVPSDAEMQDIVKDTLLDFNDALQDADFTEFYKGVSKPWQKQTSPEKLKEGFQKFIDGKVDISEISSMKASFTTPQSIVKNLGYDMLDVKGEYPTSGIKTTFDLQFVPEGKEWKLAAIKVYAKINQK